MPKYILKMHLFEMFENARKLNEQKNMFLVRYLYKFHNSYFVKYVQFVISINCGLFCIFILHVQVSYTCRSLTRACAIYKRIWRGASSNECATRECVATPSCFSQSCLGGTLDEHFLRFRVILLAIPNNKTIKQ